MAEILENIKPNRMELLKLRKRLILAEKGHRLLKEKRDALIAEFMKIVSVVRSVRADVQEHLATAYEHLRCAEAIMGTESVREISWITDQPITVDVTHRNVMGVMIPILKVPDITRTVTRRGYGLVETPAKLDEAARHMEQMLTVVLKLAEVEETVRRLAREVERTKRRVNALEYIIMPRLKATIKHIWIQIDEIERENFIRLKKIKASLNKDRATAV